MSDSVRPHRRQPTRLSHPWDSPGKNTGVGCHFLLQCMKVKSESEVTQSCSTVATPWTAAYQAPLSLGFSRQEYWSGVPLPSPYASTAAYSALVVLGLGCSHCGMFFPFLFSSSHTTRPLPQPQYTACMLAKSLQSCSTLRPHEL